MNLEADTQWIHRELDHVTDSTLIAAIKNILEYHKSVVPNRISIEQYNKEIDEAVKEVENGEYYTQEEVKKISDQW